MFLLADPWIPDLDSLSNRCREVKYRDAGLQKARGILLPLGLDRRISGPAKVKEGENKER